MKFKAAAVQVTSTARVSNNLTKCRQLVEEAASAGAKVIGLPENFSFMGSEEEKKIFLVKSKKKQMFFYKKLLKTLESFYSEEVFRLRHQLERSTIPLSSQILTGKRSFVIIKPIFLMRLSGMDSIIANRIPQKVGERFPMSSKPSMVKFLPPFVTTFVFQNSFVLCPQKE